MCECLCGEVRGDFAFRVPQSDAVICLDVYRGCGDCADLLGVDLRVFTPKGAEEFLADTEVREVEPDDYGGIPSVVSFVVVSVPDLKDAAKELEEEHPLADYESLADWLSDHGLDLLQKAYAMSLAKQGDLS